jgi:hypothetical protein
MSVGSEIRIRRASSYMRDSSRDSALYSLFSVLTAKEREIRKLGAKFLLFYVVMTVRFGMKFYNDQRNVQVFSLFISRI